MAQTECNSCFSSLVCCSVHLLVLPFFLARKCADCNLDSILQNTASSLPMTEQLHERLAYPSRNEVRLLVPSPSLGLNLTVLFLFFLFFYALSVRARI